MVRMGQRVIVPLIETKRLILRGLTEADIPFLFEHFSKNEINEFSSEDNLARIEEARMFYEKYIAPRPQLFRLGMTLKATVLLIGTIGLYGIDPENMRTLIGFDLVKEYWGKGLMSEAVLAVVDYGFREIGLNRIEATADGKNLRSLKLLERCGFRREGILREKHYYKEAFHDEVVFSLLKSEWSKSHWAAKDD